ncbi:MAG: SpoIID/LytB domain-containing protein, partial [Clostridia bacterium]|nr:SpoIID/LytB domain-containing protein [Clostridia bacterium]
MHSKRFLALILIVAVILCGLAPLASAADQEAKPVRVLLRRLGITDRLDVRMDGAYSMGNYGETSLIFTPGSEVTVTLNNGSLYVYHAGLSWNAGSDVYFTRYQHTPGEENGLRLQSGDSLYEGDLYLTVENNAIQAVLHIGLDDYVMGVVPYEMSDSFPLEALKAQAVAARTYAVRRSGSHPFYDVVDTTNDQVFKGKNAAYATALAAVAETRGQLLYYGDDLAHCYYSASNGGQMEKASHVWGGDDLPYLVYGEDPYDLANPLSIVKSYSLPKQGVLSSSLTEVLAPYLADHLKQAGYDPQAENLRIDRVLSAELAHPKHDDGSQIMTELVLTVEVSARRLVVPLPQQPDEEVYLLATLQPVQTPEPTPAPTPYYSAFTPLKEPISLSVPIWGP